MSLCGFPPIHSGRVSSLSSPECCTICGGAIAARSGLEWNRPELHPGDWRRIDDVDWRTGKMMEGFRSGRMLTARLELVAASPEDIAAELDSPGALGLRLGALVEEAWPPGEYDTDARRFFLREMREAGAGAAGWFIWYALRREPAAERPVLIAAAGFLGPPGDQGDVEIGFSVMPGWRRRGYGREIVTSLVGNAFSDSRVRRVIAQTSLRNPAACRVLEESGFERWGDFGPGGRACYVALRESGRKD